MALPQHFGNFILGFVQQVLTFGRADDESDVLSSAHHVLHGADRHKYLIVLVGSGRGPAFFAQDADHSKLQSAHIEILADRIGRVRKQLVAHGLADQADAGAFLDVFLGIKAA